MVTLQVNNKTYDLDVDGDTPLLWVLRDHLGMTGTKFGCGIGQCGSCTVHISGKSVRSCMLPAEGAQKMPITTIEGISPDRSHAVQRAWIEEDVPQCGYCQSGQIMAACALLQDHPSPTDREIDQAMGNICRCGTYQRIRRAIHRAAKLIKG